MKCRLIVPQLWAWVFLFSWITPVRAIPEQDQKLTQMLADAEHAYREGKTEKGLALVTAAVAYAPDDPKPYHVRGRMYDEQQNYQKALADFNRVLEISPKNGPVYHYRGSVYFKMGEMAKSIDDFDKYLRIEPDREPYHWQRGIAYYYAGRFKEGRRQFEDHQTVNSNDVENAVWHFLCVARSEGVKKARAALIPIHHDARTPMMQVHALFAGKAKPEDVLAAARKGNPPAARLREQLFYAHLYLGLYFEASGDSAKTREHISKAAGEYSMPHYMGDVARVHAKLAWGVTNSLPTLTK